MQLPLHTATSSLFIIRQKNEGYPTFSLFVCKETEKTEMFLRGAWEDKEEALGPTCSE